MFPLCVACFRERNEYVIDIDSSNRSIRSTFGFTPRIFIGRFEASIRNSLRNRWDEARWLKIRIDI